MKEETDTLARENDKAKANEQRIRENLVNTLTRKFMEVVKEYQKRQQVRCMFECLPMEVASALCVDVLTAPTLRRLALVLS